MRILLPGWGGNGLRVTSLRAPRWSGIRPAAQEYTSYPVTVSLVSPAAGIGVPHRTPGRSEWLLLGLLCLGTALYWSAQYHPFLVPNNDYYSFERVAKAFGSGELPRSFKRGPIFPLLMAGPA